MKCNRSRLFVDPAFQGRLMVRLVIYWTVYHVALWHSLFFFTLLASAMNHDPAVPAKTFGTLYREFAVEHVSVIICFLVLLPILMRDLLKFSHRIAGPLVRFRNTMNQMIEGKTVEPVSLRRYDLPSQFLAVFNKMLLAWNERVSKQPGQTEPAPATVEESELQLVESR